MCRGIKHLYLINGKIVFRLHLRKNKKDIHFWKVLGRPEDFSDEELRKAVAGILNRIWNELESRKSERDDRFSDRDNEKKFLPSGRTDTDLRLTDPLCNNLKINS